MRHSPPMPSSRPGGARTHPALRRVVTGGVALGVVGFLAVAVVAQWHDVDRADLHFQPAWLAAAAVLLFAFQALHGEIAVLVLRALGQPIPLPTGRSIFGAGLLARYVPSGALLFAVRLSLGERIGVPKRVSTVGIVYEVALSLAGAGVVALVLVAQLPLGWALAVALVPVGGVLALHPRIFGPATTALLRRTGHRPLDRLLSFRTVLRFIGGFVVSFVVAGLALLCTAKAITPVPRGGDVTVVAAFALGFFASLLGFALPGGIGAREAGLTAGLSLTLASPIAVAVAATSRLIQTAIELAYAGIVTAHERARRTAQATSVMTTEQSAQPSTQNNSGRSRHTSRSGSSVD